MTAIGTKVLPGSSSELVRRVARGQTDFAAVWDGTKAKFEPGGKEHELGEKVRFIQLPTLLPNMTCTLDVLDP